MSANNDKHGGDDLAATGMAVGGTIACAVACATVPLLMVMVAPVAVLAALACDNGESEDGGDGSMAGAS
jgi:hypothetical protein